MANSQIIYLIGMVWVAMFLWQMVVGTFLVRKVDLVDGGWAWGRVIGWLMVALVVWMLGHLGLAVNTSAGVRWISIAMIVLGGGVMFAKRREVRDGLWTKKWWILAEEVLFAAGLVWLVWVRAHNPDILDLEKFMDAGFMQGYMRSPTLPAEDMWLVGETINYYTFGHFMGAILMQWWGIELALAYNLILGLIMGLTLALAFSTVVNLAGEELMKEWRRGLVAGGVGALLVGVGGNSQAVWYWLKNRSWSGYWYADATRFIYNTIHEFPAYSFVVSDLHGHVWDLPVVLVFVGVLIWWMRLMEEGGGKKVFGVAGLMGGLLGVMMMTNTWDLLIYGLLTGVVGLAILVRDGGEEKILLRLAGSAGIVGLVGVIVALPWKLNFVSIDQGVRLVEQRSLLKELAILWTGHLVLMVMALVKGRKNLVILALGTVAMVLLIIPELVYVKDIYPNHPRANTMFKLTYQAFIMMSILGGWLMVKGNRVMRMGVMVIAAGLLVFPYFAYRDYYGSLKTARGLSGLGWMRVDDPGSYLAIEWLNKNVAGRPVVLEAVGESYTKNGRISVFTGLPTVLGWRVHEWLWRGGFEVPAQRSEEVKKIYEAPTSKEAKEYLKTYKVAYIVVGELEREGYQVAEKGLEKLGKVVFNQNKTKVIAVDFE